MIHLFSESEENLKKQSNGQHLKIPIFHPFYELVKIAKSSLQSVS